MESIVGGDARGKEVFGEERCHAVDEAFYVLENSSSSRNCRLTMMLANHRCCLAMSTKESCARSRRTSCIHNAGP
jgi:hypothetical protein